MNYTRKHIIYRETYEKNMPIIPEENYVSNTKII